MITATPGIDTGRLQRTGELNSLSFAEKSLTNPAAARDLNSSPKRGGNHESTLLQRFAGRNLLHRALRGHLSQQLGRTPAGYRRRRRLCAGDLLSAAARRLAQRCAVQERQARLHGGGPRPRTGIPPPPPPPLSAKAPMPPFCCPRGRPGTKRGGF